MGGWGLACTRTPCSPSCCPSKQGQAGAVLPLCHCYLGGAAEREGAAGLSGRWLWRLQLPSRRHELCVLAPAAAPAHLDIMHVPFPPMQH